MKKIAVVIPYYQREPGILRRALNSVCAQVGLEALSVFVVDDASPVPAVAELESIDLPEWVKVTVLQRSNGGPGAARNTALDALGADIRYVAFLDSDDEWTQRHLFNAVSALETGADVYFADLLQLGADVSAFSRAGQMVSSRYPGIPGLPGVREFTGDMFDQILSGNVIGTSTVVYRYDRLQKVRFQPEFRTAGEDYLFWMDLAVAGAAFVFSEDVEAVYGRGVNVYAGVSWGSVEHLWRVYYEARYRIRTQETYALTDVQLALIERKRRSLRRDFAASMLHRLARLRGVPIDLLLKQFAAEPRTGPALLAVLLRRSG